MDIGDFARFCEQNFSLCWSLSQISEQREHPQIPLTTVLSCVVQMVALGQRSLLQVDQHARSPGVRAWDGVKKRAMVVSDSTLERVVGRTDLAEARTVLSGCARSLNTQGALSVTLRSGRRIRAGIVD